MNRLGPMPRFHRQIRAIHQPTSPTSRRRCQRLRPPMRQRCDGGRPCHRGPVSWQLAEQCGIPARANRKRGSHLTSEDGSARSGSANNEKHKATIYQRLEMLVVLHCIHQKTTFKKLNIQQRPLLAFIVRLLATFEAVDATLINEQAGHR